MQILLLYPQRIADSLEKIRCFSDVWGYYLRKELSKHVKVESIVIPPNLPIDETARWFQDLDVTGYTAVISLGLRYFSDLPREITDDLRSRLFPGFLCQIYDGSRLDNDGVDITFTIKNDDLNEKYTFGSPANRFVRHRAYNEYIGWAADEKLNVPRQSSTVLRFLVDHTNYGNNPIDRTEDIICQIREFYRSGIWRDRWQDIVVRRFDSGQIVTVDIDNESPIERYDRTGIPYEEVCREHSQSHVFFVTHPESVGLVVLETATAGALIVAPSGFIPDDRLDTVKHITYNDYINWQTVLDMIDPHANRAVALHNNWEKVAIRIRDILKVRQIIRGNRK